LNLSFLNGFGVNAANKTQTQTCNVDLARTAWVDSCTFDKFNSTNGTLLSVVLSMTSAIQTEARVENIDATPRDLDANFGADIVLEDTKSEVIFTNIPNIHIAESFTAWDGNTDYAGTSGNIYPTQTNSLTNGRAYNVVEHPNKVALYESSVDETVTLPVSADSFLTFNNGLAANFATLVETFASSEINIVYNYQAHHLQIDITNEGELHPGEQGNYCVEVGNMESEQTPSGLEVRITLPDDVTFVEITDPNWDVVQIGQELILTRNTPMDPNSNDNFCFTVLIGENLSGQEIEVQAIVTSSQINPQPAEAMDTDYTTVTAANATDNSESDVTNSNIANSTINLVSVRTGGMESDYPFIRLNK